MGKATQHSWWVATKSLTATDPLHLKIAQIPKVG